MQSDKKRCVHTVGIRVRRNGTAGVVRHCKFYIISSFARCYFVLHEKAMHYSLGRLDELKIYTTDGKLNIDK